MSTGPNHVRKPWIATSLSLLCTGLGHVYCGRPGRGLVLYCSSLMFGPLIVVTAMFANSTPVLIAFLIALAALVGLVTWSIRDAWLIARRMAASDYQLQDINRPLVYGMMLSTSLPYALGLAFFLRMTVIEAFVIPSASMAPTLIPGDRVLVTKLGLNSATFQRGDVVVFRNPINRKQNFVKRVVGLPGETIEIRDGTVIIDGKPLEQTPAVVPNDALKEGGQSFIEHSGDREYTVLIDHPDNPVQVPPVKVAPDAYFVLGDHRDLSLDSREFGSVPHGLMVGIVRCVYHPAQTWNRFGCMK